MTQQANQAAEALYAKLKAEIFDFRLLPGDRFTETELALRHGVSRTPVRSALYRLRQEGYLDVQFRNGWSVRPLDFAHYDELYDLRVVLECAAIDRLGQIDKPPLVDLKAVWLVPAARRESDARRVAELDEEFHARLVAAAGNQEMVRIHAEVTEKIRIIRRLDFVKPERVATTYDEHGGILKMILSHRSPEASILLRAHISQSKTEVRKITIHMLHEARTATVTEAG
jgi:DNA-binding GntR family transcriptional regulator